LMSWHTSASWLTSPFAWPSEPLKECQRAFGVQSISLVLLVCSRVCVGMCGGFGNGLHDCSRAFSLWLGRCRVCKCLGHQRQQSSYTQSVGEFLLKQSICLAARLASTWQFHSYTALCAHLMQCAVTCPHLVGVVLAACDACQRQQRVQPHRNCIVCLQECGVYCSVCWQERRCASVVHTVGYGRFHHMCCLWCSAFGLQYRGFLPVLQCSRVLVEWSCDSVYCKRCSVSTARHHNKNCAYSIGLCLQCWCWASS
jgi:hypothetical protein